MKRMHLAIGAIVLAGASFAMGAETAKPLADTYTTLADTILGAKHTEKHLVTAILNHHATAAHSAFAAGQWEEAAAHMALWASEGDNAVGGVRKRLLEGGHHHNAEGEAQGIYEPGFVVVTIKAKQGALGASRALLEAKDEANRKAALATFEAATKLV
jgi:hypothetical protein